MPKTAPFKNCKIGGSCTDIHQGYAHFFFVVGQGSLGIGLLNQHLTSYIKTRSMGTDHDILNGGGGTGYDVGIDL